MGLKKTLLTLMALFMAASGMPVYAEQAPEPEVAETDKKLVPETGTASVLGVKKLYAEDNIASGTWGTCPWTIDADGVLTIGAGTGTDIDGEITRDSDWRAQFTPSNLPWYDYRELVTSVKTTGTVIIPQRPRGLFTGFSNAVSMDLSGFDMSNALAIYCMFSGCSNLLTLNTSGWKFSLMNTPSNDGGADSMFYNCKKLKAIDVASWGEMNLGSASFMFSGCESLESLDVSKLSFTGPNGSYAGFYENCLSLSSLIPGGTFYDGSGTYGVRLPEHTKGTGKWTLDDPYNHEETLTADELSGLDTGQTWKAWLPDDWYTRKWVWEMPGANLKFLPNSTYILSGISDYGTSINISVTSGKSGRLSFKNLEKGTYTLTEVSPTDGYIKNSVKYTVTVTDSGVSVVSDNPDFYYETADQKVLFNEPYHTFSIQKVSNENHNLGVAGAEFLLSGVSDYGTEVSQSKVTGDTGIATFDHLEAGSYLLTETKAPEHFALDPVSRIVTINKYGVVKIDGLSKEGSAFVWTDIRNADGTVTITKNWKDTLTGTDAKNRTSPSITISQKDPNNIVYNITYDLDGGTNNRSNPSQYTKGKSTITLSEPTKTGYKFIGWTGSNGDTAQKNVSITPSDEGDKTYKANWKPITYTVKFNTSGLPLKPIADMVCTYDVDYTLPTITSTSTSPQIGYALNFIGYAISPTPNNPLFYSNDYKYGPMIYYSTQGISSFRNLADVDGSVVTLTPIVETTCFDSQGNVTACGGAGNF